MNTEQHLIDRFSRQRHFTVPEGYFDTLSQRIIDSVAHEQNKVLHVQPKAQQLRINILYRYRSAVTAAACAIVIAGAFIFLSGPDSHRVDSTQPVQGLSSLAHQDDAIERAADVMMIDEDDIYMYLTDNN